MWLFLWDSEPSKIFVGDTQISKVFLWDTQVRPSWGGWWQPWANTLAYLPLEWDVLDHSGNGRHWQWKAWTGAGTPSYATLPSWKVVAKINWDWGTGNSSNVSIVVPYCRPKTVSVRMYKCTTNETWFNEQDAGAWKYFMGEKDSDGWDWWAFRLTWNYSWYPYCWFQNWGWDNKVFSQHTYIWHRQHLVATYDGTKTKYYINKQFQWELNMPILVNDNLFMWTAPFEYSSPYPEVRFFWYFSEAILEDVYWATTDIENYYDQTKADYWIS